MKLLSLTLILFSTTVMASPLTQMKNRLGDYNTMMAPDHCAAAASDVGYNSSDYGLMTSVECEIKCAGKPSVRQRVASNFIPKAYGLYPGDGSNNENTLWRSLTVTMKVWSEEICLQEGIQICKNLGNIDETHVKEIESGEWKLDSFPGCAESKVTLSPFDNTVNSKRLPEPVGQSLEMSLKASSVPVINEALKLAEKKVSTTCQHKMGMILCFGDCVHDLGEGVWKETLATPEPLGQDKGEWCMDEVVSLLKKNQGVSHQVKVKICEAYFWSSIMHSHGPGSSCAAIRGDHQCEKLIQSL